MDVDRSERKRPPSRLLRAEAVVLQRTTKLLVVLDRVNDPHNMAACMRTIEAFGVQQVWVVSAPLAKRKRSAQVIAKGAENWLSVRRFNTPAECATALKASGWSIWIASDDSDDAIALTSGSSMVAPEKLALVVGREADGVSPELCSAAHERCYVPLVGFTTSLNLSVATGLLVHSLFDRFPSLRAKATDEERTSIRKAWRPHLAKTEESKLKLATFLDDFEEGVMQDSHGAHSRSSTIASGSWAPKDIRRQEVEEEQRQANKKNDTHHSGLSSSSEHQ